jgi:predicted amidohydrolase YtcJ
MSGTRRGFGSTSAALVVLALVSGCVFAGTRSPTSPPCFAVGAPAPTTTAGPTGSEQDDLVILGRIVTMDNPPIAEALLIEAGLVTCVGTRDEVLARAGEEVPVVDIGSNVAYPGFIDAHAHWIGDRDYYGLDSAVEAMDAALRRGWTSISEQWVNPERLDELTALAAVDGLPLRVDAYLALNYGDEFFGDW